jgi:hypothetical protein
MRRAFAKSLFSAGAVVALALIPASSAFSEAPHAGDGRSRDAAAQESKNLAADELNSRDIASPDNALVRRLMAERPNEDLVICIAGCFSGRDRVVYAQPADRSTTPRKPASTSSADEQSMNGASDGMSGSITESLRGSQ